MIHWICKSNKICSLYCPPKNQKPPNLLNQLFKLFITLPDFFRSEESFPGKGFSGTGFKVFLKIEGFVFVLKCRVVNQCNRKPFFCI